MQWWNGNFLSFKLLLIMADIKVYKFAPNKISLASKLYWVKLKSKNPCFWGKIRCIAKWPLFSLKHEGGFPIKIKTEISLLISYSFVFPFWSEILLKVKKYHCKPVHKPYWVKVPTKNLATWFMDSPICWCGLYNCNFRMQILRLYYRYWILFFKNLYTIQTSEMYITFHNSSEKHFWCTFRQKSVSYPIYQK